MGLHIHAYAAPTLLAGTLEYNPDLYRALLAADPKLDDDRTIFIGRQEPFPHATHYAPGFYFAGEPLSDFYAAGGFRHYFRFRCALAALGGYTFEDACALQAKVIEGPFLELVRFYDDRGTISGPAAVKLAADFETHEEAFKASLGAKQHAWREVYDNFAAAFKAVGADGVVVFR